MRCLVGLLVAALGSPWVAAQVEVGKIMHAGMQPNALAVFQAGERVFIADEASGKIYTHSTSTLAMVNSLTVGSGILYMVVDENRGKLYAGSTQQKKIAVVDADTGALIHFLPGTYSNFPYFQLDQELGILYVLSLEGLTRVDTETDTTTEIPGFGGGGFKSMALNPLTHELFVAELLKVRLTVINGMTLEQEPINNLPGIGIGLNWIENKVYLATGGGIGSPFRVYDRDTGVTTLAQADNDALVFLFNPVSNRIYSDVEVNALSTIFEGQSDSFFNLSMPSPATGLEVRRATNHVYFAGLESTLVVDDETRTLQWIPVENQPEGGILSQAVAIHQESGRVFVINDDDLDFVTVLEDQPGLVRSPIYACYFGSMRVVDSLSRQQVDNWVMNNPAAGAEGMALEPGGGRVYLPAPFHDEVASYAGTGPFNLIDRISSGGDRPTVTVISPDGRRLYVTNADSANVGVVDLEQNELLTSVPVGVKPWGAAITPDGVKLYVANQTDGTVSVIDTGSLNVTKTVPVGKVPWGVAVNPAGTKVYVVNSGWPFGASFGKPDTVSVIDVPTNTVKTTVEVGRVPLWAAITPDGNRVFVANSRDRTVSVIDAGSDTVSATIPLGTEPRQLASHPDGSRIYVATFNGAGLSSLTEIDAVDLSEGDTIGLDGSGSPSGLAVADIGSRVAGRVSLDGGPYAGAVVQAFVKGEEKGSAESNQSGDYSIFNLTPGIYDVRVSAPMTTARTRPGIETRPGRTTVLHLDLTEDQPSRLYFPFNQAGPTSFTGFAVSNYSKQPVNLRVRAYRADGTLQAFPSNPAHFLLLTDRQLARLGSEIFGVAAGTPQSGWVELESDQAAIGSFFQFGGGSSLDGSVAFSIPSTRLFFTRVYEGPSSFLGRPAATYLSVANPNSHPVALRLTLRSSQGGEPLAEAVSRQLPPKGSFYERVSTFFGVPVPIADSYVELEVTAGDGVVGFELIRLTSDDTVIGLNAAPPNPLTRSYSAQLAGGPSIYTHLKLVNPRAQSRSVTLTAVAESGSVLGAPAKVLLAPGDALDADAGQLFGLPAGEVSVGSLQVEADGPGILGDVVFGDPSGFRYAAALPLQTRTFTRAVFSQVANTAGFFTGLALYNPGVGPAGVRIEVYSELGVLTGQLEFQLQAGKRVSDLLANLVPATAGQVRGYIVIISNSPLVGQQLFGDFALSLLSAVPPAIVQ